MLLHKIRCFLGQEKTRFLRKLNLINTDWKTALPEEVQFWADALSNPRAHWNFDEFVERTNPDLPLQDDLRKLLPSAQENIIRILDVGAGPLTRVGKKWNDKKIEITATDPLAVDYDRILKNTGITPIVRTINGEGESITTQFPENSFDLAYASNCLDHARDPIEIIKQMLLVVKPKAAVYLWHFVNVGLGERYQGLHQWNFHRVGNDLEISDGKKSILLSNCLPADCTVSSWDEFAFSSNIVVTTITKSA